MQDGNDNFRKLMIALFCAFVLVVGSWLWAAWSAENPIVVDDKIGILELFGGSEDSSSDSSSSAW